MTMNDENTKTDPQVGYATSSSEDKRPNVPRIHRFPLADYSLYFEYIPYPNATQYFALFVTNSHASNL